MSPKFARNLGLVLWAGVALPPKVIEQKIDWMQDIHALSPLHAASIDVLSHDPLIHGILQLKGRKLQTLNPDASQVLEYSVDPPDHASPEAPDRVRPLTSVNEQTKVLEKLSPPEAHFLRVARGFFTRSGDRLDFLGSEKTNFPLWSINLGFPPVRVESDSRQKTLTAWSAYPGKLVYIPPGLDSYYKITWSEDSEPVRFWSCDARKNVVVENLKNGLSRIVFFGDGMKLLGYTLFDLSGDARKSDVSAAVSANCEEIFLAGSFGLVRVRYRRLADR